MSEATQTPMVDHIQHFWSAISEPHVRILVDMRRDHEDGSFHWDSSSFGDDVAKALVGSRAGAPSRPEPAEYQRRWRECGDWTAWQRISKEFYDRLVEWPQDNELRMLYAAPPPQSAASTVEPVADAGLLDGKYPLPVEHYQRVARNLANLWSNGNDGARTCILAELLRAATPPAPAPDQGGVREAALEQALRAILKHGELGNVGTGGWAGNKPAGNPMSKDLWQFPRHMLTDIEAALTVSQEAGAVRASQPDTDLRGAAEFARSAIDKHLGDSDPPDGSEDPLFIACQKLSASLADPRNDRQSGGPQS